MVTSPVEPPIKDSHNTNNLSTKDTIRAPKICLYIFDLRREDNLSTKDKNDWSQSLVRGSTVRFYTPSSEINNSTLTVSTLSMVISCSHPTVEPEPTCTNGKIFEECGTACPLTCEQPNPLPCPAVCTRGCFCPNELLQYNGGCVPRTECPAG